MKRGYPVYSEKAGNTYLEITIKQLVKYWNDVLKASEEWEIVNVFEVQWWKERVVQGKTKS